MQRNLSRNQEDFQRVIYIDEFHFETGAKRKLRVKRPRNTRYEASNINNYNIKQRKKLSAIRCFCSKGIGPIKKLHSGVDAAAYLSFLQESVIPFAEETFPVSQFGEHNYFILHDNAPIHSSNVFSEFLAQRLTGRIIEHPPYSHDLNPIENLGSQFKRIFLRYLRYFPVNSDLDLEHLTRIAWREVGDNDELVASLVLSMTRRYQAVVNVNGNHTRY